MRIEINYDEGSVGEESPFDWNEDLIFISNHRDYDGCNNKGYTIDDFICEDGSIDEGAVANAFGQVELYPVFAYIHSGIALSLGRQYPFDCQWDSGLFGLFICPKDTFGKGGAASFIESFGQWLNGEVYYYCILDDDDEVVDSCAGFIGYENCEQAAEEALKFCEGEAKKNREQKLKKLIKNRVPLEKRAL